MFQTTTPKIPRSLIALPLPVLSVPENARALGVALGDLGWPRRTIVNRLELRYAYFLDAGHEFRSYEGEPFNVLEGALDSLFKDPGYKWLSEFPRRCRQAALTKTPSLIVQKRLQLIELGLRTPPLGYAV